MRSVAFLLALLLAVVAMPLHAAETAGWTADFEAQEQLPADWLTQGVVTIASGSAFKGANALELTRSAADREKPCTVTGPTFPMSAGVWEVSCATASELESPDASFSGVVAIELLTDTGKTMERIEIADPYGTRPWRLARKRITVPEGATTARFAMRLNKTVGRFRVDELVAKPVQAAGNPSAVDRIVFRSPSVGNLFLPADPRTFTITVESTRALVDDELTLSWVVSDYWGAEQAPTATVTIAADGTNKDRQRYRAEVDLAAIPLEQGRYYEIHAQITLSDSDPFRNWSSMAILPVAVTKAYDPLQIPFTARTWDNRVHAYMLLADRLGIRIGGIWGGSEPTPPHKPHAPLIDVAAKLGMTVLTGAPAGVHAIEHHRKGYELWTEEALRGGIRSWFAAYGNATGHPIVVNLGNEPHNTGERLKEAVWAYKIAYDEIKKVAPQTIVVATSIGATEEYFELGYHEACDAFDFHVYESPRNVREAIRQFQVMMKRYNCEKPIWSTEIGLNSQGMTRQYIAGDMARKTVAFFAAGGANMSWFGFLYPDADGKGGGTTGDAFNMFDSRYNTYGARLDAVMHYNLVNGISVKSFTDERIWDDGINGCLFRDADGACFVVLWKDKGVADVQLPLGGVGAVRCVRIDGRVSELHDDGSGLCLTIGEDPLLLEYRGAATLPEALAEPVLRIAAAPTRMVRGTPATVTLATRGDANAISLIAPPGWSVERDAAMPLRFTITSPVESRVREGDLLIRLAGANGTVVGELAARPAVTGQLGIVIRPVPPAVVGAQPSAEVVLHNLSEQEQAVTWTFALTGERSMAKGQFARLEPTSAFLADVGEGTATLPANSQTSIVVPLAGIDPIRLYQATAAITDATGGTVAAERLLGGFVGVRRATPKLDGVLDEAAWGSVSVHHLNQAEQYLSLDRNLTWQGEQDLSAELRFLWDDEFLYIGVAVIDDVFANTKADGNIWAGDGLQFLFDPRRESAEKPGKYDLGMAVGTKGPQAWCWLTASSDTTPGLVKSIQIAMKRGANGNATYEVAIPWTNLAPFTPGVGENLGATMIINEDDGPGRKSFIGWFGNPHTKQIDTAGDLILLGD